MSYPATPGYKVDGPSRDAAIAMIPTAGTLRYRVFNAIEKAANGLTADECAELLSETVLAIRPRFTELANGGWIEDAGTRRKNASGRAATVWRAARV